MMYKDKNQTDAKQDLSLYIEGLLRVDEEEPVKESRAPAMELVEAAGSFEKIETPVPVESRPAWAEQTFDCLMLHIAGMQLLLPARNIAFVEKVNKKITRLPLENAALHGIIKLRQRSVAIIDVFRLINASSPDMTLSSMQVTENFIKHAVIIGESRYAIACDSVGSLLAIDPASVRWNKSSFKNRFYCGVASEQLCPLIDIDELDKAVAAMPFVQSLNTHLE